MDRYKETFDTGNNLAFAYQERFMDAALYNDPYDYICNAVATQPAKPLT